MEAYLDNSATTRCYEEVKDIVVKTMTEDFGNPSAMHLKGVEAENYIEATFKAQKKYPSDKYTHMLIDTDVEKWPADISMF